MTAPRIPRHRAPIIPARDGRLLQLWIEFPSVLRIATGVAVGLCLLAVIGVVL